MNKITVALYISVTKEGHGPKLQALSDLINTMSYKDRIVLRQELEKCCPDRLLRNLYFDYVNQTWVTAL